MSDIDDIDAYLAALEEPARSTLEEVRRRILEVIPHAEQVISYGMPGFTVKGKVVAGFASFSKHLSYFPHSGQTLGELRELLADYSQTKSGLHFAFDEPLPREVIKALIRTRLGEAGLV